MKFAHRKKRKEHMYGGYWGVIPFEWLQVMKPREAMMISYIRNIACMKESVDEMDEDGWFDLSNDHLRKAMHMTRREEGNCLSIIEERGVIERKMKGNPAKRHFRINYEALEEWIGECEIDGVG